MPIHQGIHKDRSVARRKAVQIIYQSQITGQPLPDAMVNGLFVDEVGVPCEYTQRLIAGIAEHLDEIDSLIDSISENWSIERMPLVDRGILRLAVYEIKYENSVPVGVSINEAIELARDFGGADDSSKFINGVLGKVALSSETSKKISQEQ
ncbi:N utilization substance protein B [Actinomycetota bacterium]|nr:N utilization substance protein B [Actinomycetota bacterium]